MKTKNKTIKVAIKENSFKNFDANVSETKDQSNNNLKTVSKLDWIGFGFSIAALTICILELLISVSLSIWNSNVTKNIAFILNWVECGVLLVMFGIFLSILLILKSKKLMTTTIGKHTLVFIALSAIFSIPNFFAIKHLNMSILCVFQLIPSIMILSSHSIGRKMKAISSKMKAK